MFVVSCPRHGTDVLLWPSNVLGLHTTTEGIVVAYRCHCGHRGVWLTGRGRRADRALGHRAA